MSDSDFVESVRSAGQRMIAILGLEGSPVGVRLLATGQEEPAGATVLNQHRYCQALMRARRGQSVLLDAKGIACPAAAAAFGFHPLPEGLASGKGLVGFGIVAEPAVGKRMFEGMSRLAPGQIRGLHLFPLDQAEQAPDIIVVEDQVEKLMWISLSSLNVTGGERLQSSTAILQATCVDSTIIPYLEHRLNLGYGCYGCRDATDLASSETALGFPGELLPGIVQHLEYLNSKALPTARSKRAWAAMQRRDGEGQTEPDIAVG